MAEEKSWESEWARAASPHIPHPLALTLFWHVQGLHYWLDWECSLMSSAGPALSKGCWAATMLLGLLRWGLNCRPHPTVASFLPGAGAGREHTLHQLLHGQEVSTICIHMSAQLSKVLTL